MQRDTEHRVALRLPESLYQEIEKYTIKTGMSITEFLRRACRDKLDREMENAPKECEEAVKKALVEYVSDERLLSLIRRAIAEEQTK